MMQTEIRDEEWRKRRDHEIMLEMRKCEWTFPPDPPPSAPLYFWEDLDDDDTNQ